MHQLILTNPCAGQPAVSKRTCVGVSTAVSHCRRLSLQGYCQAKKTLQKGGLDKAQCRVRVHKRDLVHVSLRMYNNTCKKRGEKVTPKMYTYRSDKKQLFVTMAASRPGAGVENNFAFRCKCRPAGV